MMALTVGEKDSDKVLVARYNGKIYSCGNFCTHFGVPLAQSVLFDDRVICPAHNAAFSIITGEPEYAPAFTSLPTFEVVEEDGKFFVKLPSDWNKSKNMYMAKRDTTNPSRYVIVGGGAAGLSAAETLRQSDFTGEIIILTAENKIAYDRTLVSKLLTSYDPDKFALRKQDFCDEYGIEFRTNSLVKQVDVNSNEVVLADNSRLGYDKLLLATGGSARRPIVPGIDLQNVFTLRSAQDQAQMKDVLGEGKKIVVIGASFIGYECAASLVSTFKDKVSVRVVEYFNTPFERTLGKEVGGVLQSLGEENGIQFTCGHGMKQLIGKDGVVTGVELDDGTIIEADAVILGTGIQPVTQYVQDGIDLEQDGSIKVDPFLRTTAKNVYAAGDIASYPYWVTGERIRVEHWNHAIQQGEIAAFNMLDKSIPYDTIPFFWTRNFMKSVQYTGYHRSYDEVFIDGDLKEQKFVAYYIKDNKVLAAAGLNCGTSIHVIKEAMRLGLMPSADQIKDKTVTPTQLKETIQGKKGSSVCMRKQCCQKQPK